MSTKAISLSPAKVKAVTIVAAIAGAIVLPQLFHAVGAISGTGSLLGSTFLPMHIPILVAALMGGPIVGICAGLVSPLLSFAISGMPAVASLPFMIIELMGYGLVGGMLAKSKQHVFVKLIITQIAGRALRAIAVLLAVYALSATNVKVSSILTMVTVSLPGILLQWALLPLLLRRMDGLKGLYA